MEWKIRKIEAVACFYLSNPIKLLHKYDITHSGRQLTSAAMNKLHKKHTIKQQTGLASG